MTISQRYPLVVSRAPLFLLCLFCLSMMCRSAQADDDTTAYTMYAETQQAQAAQKMAPYRADIQAIAQRAYQLQPSVPQHPLQPITDVNASDHAQNPEIATPGDILIFVSFSMPETSLQQWSEQARRFHAPLIVRGLANDSFVQTQVRLATLLGNKQAANGGAAVLEPRLFKDYQITQVPAVVVRNTAITCPMTQNCPHVYPYDVVAGDIGLEDALTMIARQDGAATETARGALQAWRGSR